MHPPHLSTPTRRLLPATPVRSHAPVSRRVRAGTALGLVTLLLLVGCGSEQPQEPASPQPGDPWPLSPPPDDPMAWIAEQRDPATATASTTGSVDDDALTVGIGGAGTGTQYTAAGAGISFEATDLADDRLSAENPDLVRILKQLDQPTLRFGGNSVDRRLFFTDSQETAPQDWPLRSGERITTVTPEDLARLAELAQATDAHVILSVNLADGDPERAASMVGHAHTALGDRLVGVMIGNEPNGYALGEDNPLSIKDADWDTDQFRSQWRSYVQAIRAEVPETTIVGPGAYDAEWWRTVTEAGVRDTVLAVHQYPLSECGDPDDTGFQSGSEPTIENTVSQQTRDRVDTLLGRAVELANRAQMDTWVTETSASSCSGSNELTETLAAGLYTADYVLRAQLLGVDRVDFHSSLLPCKGGPPMSVICASGTVQNPGDALVPRTNGLALAVVGSLPTGEFRNTTVTPADGGESGPGAQARDVVTYAIAHDDGSTSVILVDFRDPEQAQAQAVTLNLPHGVAGARQTTFGGSDLRDNYPETTLFDGHPSAESPTTEDADGVALDVRGAITAVPDGAPSVDGYGLPLMPPDLQSEVSGVAEGDSVIHTTIEPGSVSVISTRPI